MTVGMIDVDSHNFPNLALMKLSAFHKAQGDLVEWYQTERHYDLVYQSKVFDDTYTKDIDFIPQADRVVKGGTGYGIPHELPEAIEHIMPDYSLYGITDRAYGFLTRGCPRHCPFCIVGDKEGLQSRKVADLSEFWNGQPNIELLDPNLLACPQRMELLDQLIKSRAMVNISQGFDIRLTTEEIAEKLGRMRLRMIHFAWDNPKQDLEPYFRRFAEAYRRKAHNGKCVYILVNFNSTMEENLHRIYTVRDLGYDPYVMVYDKPHAPVEIRQLQRWVNNKFVFGKCKTFSEYHR